MRISIRGVFDGKKMLTAEDVLFCDVEQRMTLVIQTESHEDKLQCLVQLRAFRKTVGKCYFTVDALTVDDYVTVVTSPSQVLMILDNMEPFTQVMTPTRMDDWCDAEQLRQCLQTDARCQLRAHSLWSN